MKTLPAYILYLFCLILLPNLNVTGQTYLDQFQSKLVHSLTLEGRPHILNFCEEQPEQIQQIFKTVCDILNEDTQHSFAYLAEDSLFVKLCRENGITHTGGPMLGNATSEGVDIWIRTLTPSKVEARITADGKVKFFGPVASTLQSDLVAVVKVAGLKADTLTMFSDYVSDGKDSWGAFDPEGREKIFSLIEKNNIGGVLLISGDRHGARGFEIPWPSGFKFYEFEVASLGGKVGPPPVRADWDTQLYGISGEYVFGEFSFDTTLLDPEVTFRLIDDSGTIFYELTLSKNQLTP